MWGRQRLQVIGVQALGVKPTGDFSKLQKFTTSLVIPLVQGLVAAGHFTGVALNPSRNPAVPVFHLERIVDGFKGGAFQQLHIVPGNITLISFDSRISAQRLYTAWNTSNTNRETVFKHSRGVYEDAFSLRMH